MGRGSEYLTGGSGCGLPTREGVLGVHVAPGARPYASTLTLLRCSGDVTNSQDQRFARFPMYNHNAAAFVNRLLPEDSTGSRPELDNDFKEPHSRKAVALDGRAARDMRHFPVQNTGRST